MTFVITLYVREGIVMAADSRLTLNQTKQAGPQVIQMAVGQSDSTRKTFLTPDNVGIITYGDADINGVPITGYIESFIHDDLPKGPKDVNDVAQRVLTHFQKLPGPPKIFFHVGGYKKAPSGAEQQVWLVDVISGTTVRLNQNNVQGASWGGETDTVSRIVMPVGIVDSQGNLKQVLPYFAIPWGFFTLQDAIDFAVYTVKLTIDSIRFQPRPKTVGGPIDVVIIKPDGAQWIQRKELHV